MSSKAFSRVSQPQQGGNTQTPRNQMQGAMMPGDIHQPTGKPRNRIAAHDDGEWEFGSKKPRGLMPWHHPLR